MEEKRPTLLADEDFAESEGCHALAPYYFSSRRIAEALCAEAITEETMKAIAGKVAKEVSGAVFDAISDFLWDGGIENNMHLMADNLVDDALEAVVSGNKVLASRIALRTYDPYGVRAAIAKLVPDEVLQARIADLEKEVERLTEMLERANRRYA